MVSMAMEVNTSDVFDDWYDKFKNLTGKTAILRRIDRFENENFGDVKSLGSGIFEARIHIGAGYRFYYAKVGLELVVLLCGVDKSSQQRDIVEARSIFEEFKWKK